MPQSSHATAATTELGAEVGRPATSGTRSSNSLRPCPTRSTPTSPITQTEPAEETAAEVPAAPPLDVDVLVIGAGIAGVDVACRLSKHGLDVVWAVLEARAAIGGTWDLFRFPGIRSDSDMYTLGYPFRPWPGRQAIADGGGDPRLRAGDRRRARDRPADPLRAAGRRGGMVVGRRRWTVDARTRDGGAARRPALPLPVLRLLPYAAATRPTSRARARSRPGRAPAGVACGLDVEGRRVVVIGSGATAVTLVPALAERGAHVTMLQRSPTWMLACPAPTPCPTRCAAAAATAAATPRRPGKNILTTQAFFQICHHAPSLGKRMLRGGPASAARSAAAVDTDFAPRYDPWDQRLCVVPDADFFRAMKTAGEVVTDRISGHPGRHPLASGELPGRRARHRHRAGAGDRGGIAVTVDGVAVEPGETARTAAASSPACRTWRSASATSTRPGPCGPISSARWFCSCCATWSGTTLTVATPRYDEPNVGERPLLDLTSVAVQRAAHLLPRQGQHRPWRVVQNYVYDLAVTGFGRIDDGHLDCADAGCPGPEPAPSAAPCPAGSRNPAAGRRW